MLICFFYNYIFTCYVKLCVTVREHQQKTFNISPLRGWGYLKESIKKGKFVTKSFFQMLNKILKTWEK